MRTLRIGRRVAILGVAAVTGCAGDRAVLPTGHLPAAAGVADSTTAARLNLAPPAPPTTPRKPFDLPSAVPGADAADAVKPAPPLAPAESLTVSDAAPLGLAELQHLALANSPHVRRARAEADAAFGQVVQAGLHPNPTVGYQADQVQPGLNVPPGAGGSGAGQQGGFINLLIKTCGKVALARRVAGYDYVNALVAVRRAEVDAAARVRAAYFAALVARRGEEIHTALAAMADEVYALQQKRVAAGLAPVHEPYQFRAQAVQARAAAAQAAAAYRTAWGQLAAAVGDPGRPVGPLAGTADAPPPAIDAAAATARVLETHTALLTARNTVAQAQANLLLQQKQPVPDLQTNTYHQYDNLAQTYQFGVQLGVQLPAFDRNQGNIRTARAKVAAGGEALRAAEVDTVAAFAEAAGRVAAAAPAAKAYREQVLPDLARVYRGVLRQSAAEPDKVPFNDVVVAQQTYSQALREYLALLDAQWKAVADAAAAGQWDELYPAN